MFYGMKVLMHNFLVFCMLLLMSSSLVKAETTTLTVKGEKEHTFTLEVPRTPEGQAKGLMNRTELKDDGGMLFLYAVPQRVCFWMKDTLVALDLIIIDANSKILEIIPSMKPKSIRMKCSQSQAIAAIEVKAGTCEHLGLKAGDSVSCPLLPTQSAP
jgi:uncharacterized membrane protein (UPF0127 family)